MANPLWLGNTHFPHGWKSDMSLADAKAIAAKARKHRKALVAALKQIGKGKGKTEKQKAYYGSTLVRLDALINAAKRLEYHERLEVPAYQDIAAKLKLHGPIEEPVHVHLKKKSSGGYRYFCSFGVRHRAAQTIVADMVNAQFTPRHFQFNAAGRGVKDAVKKVRELHAKGHTYAVRLDIKTFFDSFDHDAIMAMLPIPKDIIEHIVVGKHHHLHDALTKEDQALQHILQDYLSLIGHTGLPQGSACSPAITNFFMSKIEPKLPKGARFLNYVDDFLILAQSPERGQKAKNALSSSIEEMSVGHFELLEKSSGSIHSGVEFLGHRFSEGDDGKIRVTVTPANLHKFSNETGEDYNRIEKLYGSLKDKPWGPFSATEANVKFAVRILCWLRTFSEADGIAEHEQDFMGLVESLALATGQDPQKIMNLAKLQKLRDVGVSGG